MGRHRDIMNEARKAIHQTLEVDALYLVPAAGVPGTYEDPVPVKVRVHDRAVQLGDLKGTSFDYAVKADNNPQVIFLREEMAAPARNAIVSVEAGEAYAIDSVEAPHGVTVAANVTRLRASETVGLPVPEVD